jgi:cysteinyl-tRNA synthetase
MEWDSPWGTGFPGWHIECSAMSMKYLGETLDIHAGGIDHVPVHHTNEIAQSEAVTGKPFANAWMHSNHITIEGEKVSKSLGNGITLEDIEAKGISFEAFRLHVLESHYRSQSKFSWESLQAAQNRLRNWQAVATLRWQAVEQPNGASTFVLADVPDTVHHLLADDLNTPAALAFLSTVFGQLEVLLITKERLPEFETLLERIDRMLGLSLGKQPDISDTQKQLLREREDARVYKDWAKSDALRDQLVEQGIGLRDTNNGAIWYRL